MINYLYLPFEVLLSCGPLFTYVTLPLFLISLPIFAVYFIKSLFGVI